MFTITVKGRTLNELNLALKDAEKELNLGKLPTKVEKDLGVQVSEVKVAKEVVEAGQLVSEVNNVKTVELDQSDLDSYGVPWDKRIHATSKTKKQDGTWKLRRGVDKDLVEEVKSEIKTTSIKVKEPVSEVKTPELPQSNGHTVESFIANFPLIIAQLISEGSLDQEYIKILSDYYEVDQIWKLNDTQKTEVFKTLTSCQIISKVY